MLNLSSIRYIDLRWEKGKGDKGSICEIHVHVYSKKIIIKNHIMNSNTPKEMDSNKIWINLYVFLFSAWPFFYTLKRCHIILIILDKKFRNYIQTFHISTIQFDMSWHSLVIWNSRELTRQYLYLFKIVLHYAKRSWLQYMYTVLWYCHGLHA